MGPLKGLSYYDTKESNRSIVKSKTDRPTFPIQGRSLQELGEALYLDQQGYKSIEEKLKPNKQTVRLKHNSNKARPENKKLSPTSQKNSGHQNEESKISNSWARGVDSITGCKHKSLSKKSSSLYEKTHKCRKRIRG